MKSVDLGNVTSYTLSSLTTGTTYYSALSSYDGDGNASWVSTNVTATPLWIPVKVAFSTQPGNGSAGTSLSVQPVIAVQDLDGANVTSSSHVITLSITTGTGTNGATLDGTVSVAAVNGVATFSNLGITTAGEDYTLTATASGLTGAVSNTFDISAGSASSLTVVSQPSDTRSGTAFSTQPSIQVIDAYGNRGKAASVPVTATITASTGTAGATLTGTATVAPSDGIASFSGFSVDLGGADYTLTFSASGLGAVTSSAFDIISASASGLAFNTQPPGGTAGNTSALTTTVHVTDSLGNLLTDAFVDITIAITAGTGDSAATLLGTTTVKSDAGVAVFNGIRLEQAATNYTLTASSSWTSSIASQSFDISAGTPITLGFQTNPGAAAAGLPLTTQPVVVLQDAYGNTVSSAPSVAVTVVITSSTGTAGAALSGTNSVYTTGVTASFTNLSIDTVGTGYSLTAAASGYASVTSQPFAITGIGQTTANTLNAMDAVTVDDRWAVGLSGTIIATSDAGDTWWAQSSGTSQELLGVDFINRRTGWVVGNNGTILHTTNGGHTWISVASGTTANLYKVRFYDANRGMIVGAGGVILSTTNAGASWTTGTSGTSRDLRSVSFATTSRAWAVGDQGEILTTTDTGQTWTPLNSGTSRNLRAVRFLANASNGWAVGGDGTILRTTNGGSTWTSTTISSGQDLNGVSFVTSEKGWAVGRNGTVVRTVNGGVTWTNVSSGVSSDLQDVVFLGNPEGGAVGNDGTVLSSSDAGQSWTQQNGILSENTTWASTQPNVSVTGHVTVTSGVTLTIDPGVTVKFHSGKSLVIDGGLVARGTASNGITFTSSAISPAAGDWAYIRFTDSTINAAFDGSGNYTGGSILEYVTISYSGGSGPAVWSDEASLFINQSTIQFSGNTGIQAQNVDATFKITNSLIDQSTSTGVECFVGDNGTCDIRSNTITNNGYHGISTRDPDRHLLRTTSTITIAQNTISGNTERGILLGGATTISVTGNTVTTNGKGIACRGLESNCLHDITGVLQTLTISNNIVTGNTTGLYVEAVNNANVIIEDNVFHNNTSPDGAGVTIVSGRWANSGGTANLTFTGNQITDNTDTRSSCPGTSENCSGAARFVLTGSGTIDVSNNTISGNSAEVRGGLNLYLNATTPGIPGFHGNTITNNSSALSSHVNRIVVLQENLFYQNNITGTTRNSTQGLYDLPLGTGSYATNNWWGTTDATELQTLIYDFSDDPNLGVLAISPVLTSPSTSAPPSPPSGVAAQTGPTSLAFSWSANPESDITGYKLHYDTDAAGYPYANTVDLGNVTSYTLSSLTTGTTYYSALSAYDGDGNASWVSSNVTAVPLVTLTKLVFSTQPVGSLTGGTFVTLPVITLQDDLGNTATGSSNAVTLSITSGTGTAGAILSGTTTINALNGVASFSDLSIDRDGSSYTLTATSPDLTSVASNLVTITTGVPNRLVFTTQPVGGPVGVPLHAQPIVTIRNNSDNTVTSSTAAVTISITPDTSENTDAILSGTMTVNAVNGIATFTDLSIDQVGSFYTFTATSSDHASATSAAFSVVNFGAAPALGQTVLWILFGAFAVMFIVLMIRRRSITDRVPD